MKHFPFFLIAFCLPLFALSQTEDDFSKYRQRQQEKYNQYVQNEQQKWSDFLDSINRDFAKKLQNDWQKREMSMLKQPITSPTPPVFAPQQQNVVANPDLPVKEVCTSSIVEEKESLESSSPLLQNELNQAVMQEQIVQNFSFYGNKMQIGISADLSMPMLTDMNEKAIANMWSAFSNDDFMNVVKSCNAKRKDQKMCDWAAFLMVSALAEQLYPNNHRERVVFVVFSLNQMGFDTRMGMAELKDSHKKILVCLLNVKQEIYRTPMVTVEGKDYYVFLPGAKQLGEIASIVTYESDLTERQKQLNLKISYPFIPSTMEDEVTYTKTIKGKNIEFRVNENLLDFYADYPSTDLQVYASSQPSENWIKQVDAFFGPLIEGESQQDAVNTLLEFMYQGFEYVPDDEQFGKEKYFFCEENFYYGKNDCEDRAILFSFLVRHLLHLDVVLLNYNGHVATAVCFTDSNVAGDGYKIKGKRYIVCDPTYINAGVGRAMPEFRDKAVEIIML